MRKMRYIFSKLIIKLFGDVQFFPAPMFCLFWGDTHYQVKGGEVREVLNMLEVGDILVCRFDRYVSSWFIPGFWTHVALYVGDDKVVHAMTKGVVEDDVLTFMRTDYVAVLRLPVDDHLKDRSVELVREFIGKDYDFLFETTDDERVYCSELVKRGYPGVLDDLGSEAIPPDRFFEIEGVKVVHDSREWRKNHER